MWCAFIVLVDSVQSGHSHAFGDWVSWLWWYWNPDRKPWVFLTARGTWGKGGWCPQNVSFNISKRQRKGKPFLPGCQGFSVSALLTFWVESFRFGGCPVHCQMLSSISGLYSLDASSISSVVTAKNVSWHCQMSLWGRGDNRRLGTTGLTIVRFIPNLPQFLAMLA